MSHSRSSADCRSEGKRDISPSPEWKGSMANFRGNQGVISVFVPWDEMNVWSKSVLSELSITYLANPFVT
ncbi:uncharacterized protein RCO7_14471 [Rhynchosporium graminicola]|uniref:Uncharacterized protein n=1 Tax=Rhynchosporium graminicola TaxID=2792576 RepID=A0A1E1KJP9_9HELO|nr:uncharacterized protein RCO7_14471 [Rhynchosporium commune]